jgi:gluconate 5-dehydrogenase
MARGFAEAGADVVISSRHGEELESAAAEIRSGTGVRVAHFVADITRREDVRRLADSALEAMGHVDILVNNAGSNIP